MLFVSGDMDMFQNKTGTDNQNKTPKYKIKNIPD